MESPRYTYNVSPNTQNAVAPRARAAGPHPTTEATRSIALAAVKAALDTKALEPLLLEVGPLASYTDYILVVSGRSDRQVEAIGESIVQALKEKGVRTLGVEGMRGGTWTLIDFGDLIVHVFYHPVREHYDLESLWIDATRVPLDVPPESRISPEL